MNIEEFHERLALGSVYRAIRDWIRTPEHSCFKSDREILEAILKGLEEMPGMKDTGKLFGITTEEYKGYREAGFSAVLETYHTKSGLK